jgi:hypothetical protein
MHLLLVGFLAVVLSNQVFRKSEEFCPYGQTTYIKVAASSVISCAANCDKEKGGCSRFVLRKGHPDRDNDRRIFEAMTSTKEQCTLNITFQSPNCNGNIL